MKYCNPIIPGFYPDPSVCRAGDSYYLVTSSFEYFPGIPLFKSHDLINWTNLGSVLTRPDQLPLKGSDGHGGIFAPTIRYHKGSFYVVGTNIDHGGHFLVSTQNPARGWSKPRLIKQEGIDPSLFFEEDQAYFLSTGKHEGRNAILMSKIDLNSGQVSDVHFLWAGTGGRYLEGPHLYKIGQYYYLLASEGGTEYGHMLVCARSSKLFGPYESCPANPILTNRNLGGYQLQGAGHGDFVQDNQGNWWVVFLAFRQLDRYLQFHTLGREVCLLPVDFKDGWPVVDHGVARLTVNTKRQIAKQRPIAGFKQEQAHLGREWFFLRNPDLTRYRLQTHKYLLYPGNHALSERISSPTALLTRQRSFYDALIASVNPQEAIAGLTAYLEPNLHYDLLLRRKGTRLFEASVRLQLGPAESQIKQVTFTSDEFPRLEILCHPRDYQFVVISDSQYYDLGSYEAQYLSSEVAGDFTGVMLGLFTEKEYDRDGQAAFTNVELIR